MKEKILALLLAVTALTVSGCGMDIGVIGGEDGPTEVIVSGPGVSETVQLPEEEVLRLLRAGASGGEHGVGRQGGEAVQ